MKLDLFKKIESTAEYNAKKEFANELITSILTNDNEIKFEQAKHIIEIIILQMQEYEENKFLREDYSKMLRFQLNELIHTRESNGVKDSKPENKRSEVEAIIKTDNPVQKFLKSSKGIAMGIAILASTFVISVDQWNIKNREEDLRYLYDKYPKVREAIDNYNNGKADIEEVREALESNKKAMKEAVLKYDVVDKKVKDFLSAEGHKKDNYKVVKVEKIFKYTSEVFPLDTQDVSIWLTVIPEGEKEEVKVNIIVPDYEIDWKVLSENIEHSNGALGTSKITLKRVVGRLDR